MLKNNIYSYYLLILGRILRSIDLSKSDIIENNIFNVI